MKNKKKFKQTEIGLIPEDWEVVPASEYCLKVTDGTHDTPKKVNSKHFLITSRHLGDSQIKFNEAYTISDEEFFEVNKRSKVDQWDVIFSMIGTVGLVYLEKSNKIDYAIKNVGLFKSKKAIDGRWLFYYLKSPIATAHINASKAGTTQAYLTLDTLRKFPIILTKDTEREKIVGILESIDSKIELNQQINKTLEAIGQAIFKHWFIDFEFPNEKGKPYKSSGGEMVDSELGKIPKGWTVSTLREFIMVERGLSYKGSGLTEDGLPMINLANFAPNHGFINSATKPYSGEYKERNLVKAGDIVIANTDITQKRDVLGSPAIVPNLESEKILFTHHVYAVRNKSWIPNYFIYYLLQLKQYEDRTRGFATGTTVLFLPDDAILDFQFVLSNKELVEKFVSTIKMFQDRLNLNTSEHITLTILRDSLLSRLMSGKIRVPVEVRA